MDKQEQIIQLAFSLGYRILRQREFNMAYWAKGGEYIGELFPYQQDKEDLHFFACQVIVNYLPEGYQHKLLNF